MSLHLGNDIVISSKQLLAILNLHNLKADSGLLQLLKTRKGTQHLRVIGSGKTVSAVLCNRGTLYLSPIDATTLARRANSVARSRKRVAGKNRPQPATATQPSDASPANAVGKE